MVTGLPDIPHESFIMLRLAFFEAQGHGLEQVHGLHEQVLVAGFVLQPVTRIVAKDRMAMLRRVRMGSSRNGVWHGS